MKARGVWQGLGARRWGWGVWGLVWAGVMTAGCASPARFRAEVVAGRARAAEAWSGARSEEGGPFVEGTLSREEAVRLALAHNKDLQAAYREQEVARGRVLESYAAALPHASLSAGYTRLDEVPRIEAGPQTLSMGFEDNYEARVSVRQPLFHGMAIPAALRTARWYALWSEQAVRAARQGVIFRTQQAYDDVLLAQELERVHEEALRFAEAFRDDVKKRRAQGVATDYDVLRAEVEVSAARAAWLQQKHERDLAMTRLLRTMGVSPQSRVALADGLTAAPRPAELAGAVGEALRRRPELFQAEYALRMQREAVRVAQSEFWPEVGAFFSGERSRPDPHAMTRDEWGEAWSAGVSLTLPLFEGMARRGKLVQERARLEQAEVRLRAEEEAVALEVQEAVLSLLNAEELVASQRMNLERAEEGLRLAQAGYREGVRSQLEVLDAQTALTRARALYYQALRAQRGARLNFDRAVGALGEAEPTDRGRQPGAEGTPTEAGSTAAGEDGA